jgi:hypothetical protein
LGLRLTSAGGSATVNANGSFTYEPPLGAQNTADTFTYATFARPPITVTITLVERAWHVQNNFVGVSDGSSDAPFLTLAQAAAAADDADTLFLFAGNGLDTNQNTGISLLAGEKLIGEGFGLTVGGNIIVAVKTTVPTHPVISNAGLVLPGITPVVEVADNNEVAGIQFQAAANEAVRANGVTGFNIHHNVIPNPNREGIRIINVTGRGTVADNTISGSLREGIDFNNVEDAATNPVLTPITASVTIAGNTVSNSALQGIGVVLDGAATDVALSIKGNTVDNSLAEGIRISSGLGAAVVDVNARDNTLVGNGGVADFSVQASGTSDMCVELTDNNGIALNTATFQVNNAGTVPFLFFELGNDAPAVRLGIFSPVSGPGICAVP